MYLVGEEYINKNLKLQPGDRFRVCIELFYDDDGDLDESESTPNIDEDMARYDNQWLTVTSVSEEPDTFYGEDHSWYEGYVHYTEDEPWSWWWFHMDAIDRLVDRPKAPLVEQLPDI